MNLFQLRRECLNSMAITSLMTYARLASYIPYLSTPYQSEDNEVVETPTCPEDFKPLENSCFQNPFPFYQMLRDDYPVYTLPNGVVCISRFDDIVAVSRDVEHYSSEHQGIVANLKPGQDLLKVVKRFNILAEIGLIPADVFATSDPPSHTSERKVGHSGLNGKFVKTLEGSIDELCQKMLDDILPRGEVEFMKDFGWKLPMLMILSLLGLPESDFEKIKGWCVEILDTQNGIQSSAQYAHSYASALKFLDYCWHKYLEAQHSPGDNLIGLFVRAANNPDVDFDDKRAVSSIFQLIIAGSDSSATTMGNALKVLIENPDVQQELRDDPERISAFIEEVFRMESAFQGHFRWVKKDTELHGVKLKRGTRIFLMWASGNRDERVYPEPHVFKMDRPKAKKHLTFGHGIHACIGRELARSEIKVVLKAFLDNTENLTIDGETPFVASMFSRTLLRLPIKFDVKAKNAEKQAA